MNKMYEFLKQNHDMKNFDHVKLNVELPDILPKVLRVKDFMLHLKVTSIHQSQLFYQIETKKVLSNGESQ